MKRIKSLKDSRWLPPMADIIFVAVFIYLAVYAGDSLLDDCDTGFHIRTGEYILNTHTVPEFDIFSFSVPPIPWTAHEWLSEIIMAAVHKWYGLTGIVILFAFVTAAVYYALYQSVQGWNGNIFLQLIVVSLAILASEIHWLARPHLFSLFLIVVWYWVLDLYQYKTRNYVYILPGLMLLWVNLHGSFITGFILNMVYIAGNIVYFFFNRENKGAYAAKIKTLGGVTVACLAASLVNPHGCRILLFPFKLVSNETIMDNVNEFLSPNFHEPMFYTLLLLSFIAYLAVSKEKLNFIELTLVLFFIYMSLYSVRYVPLFAIIVTPVIVRHAANFRVPGTRLLHFVTPVSDWLTAREARVKKFFFPALAIAAVFVLMIRGGIHYDFDEEMKPVRAVEFLKKESLPGNMFDNDEFGDYIIYAAWPRYKVFVDGRSDMYGEERMKEYFRVARVHNNWAEVIEKYRINWVIFNSDSMLSRFLLGREDWKLIYSDDVANIFIRNIPENSNVIEKYKDVKPVEDSDD